jgi:predicted enzyme related to lactoylglutathione lyase
MAGDFIWYELWCSDVAKAKEFYAKIVGWRISDPGDGYNMIQGADDQLSAG